jgi:hypothetical protein
MLRLFEIGFQVVGHWCLSGNEPKLQLTNMQNDQNVIYAFVVDENVMYIGKTTQPLEKRMYGYQRPGPTQSTNIKNRANILEALEKGRDVQILGLRDNGLHHYGSFHINLAAGLEDDLINKLNPEWNGRVRAESARPVNERKADQQKSVSPETFTEKRFMRRNMDKSLQATIPLPENCFILTLHSAYFNSGFFNVGVRYQHLFGADLEEISISCDGLANEFTGYINRSANTNHTPRIMGGVPLKRWFQEVSELNGHIHVEVISPHSIKMNVFENAMEIP